MSPRDWDDGYEPGDPKSDAYIDDLLDRGDD